MGFFSWDCHGCRESIKAPFWKSEQERDDIGWQNDAVALLSNGSRAIGEYDGYGRIGAFDVSDEPDMWHRKCWTQAGKPEYAAPSRPSDDQGFFR